MIQHIHRKFNIKIPFPLIYPLRNTNLLNRFGSHDKIIFLHTVNPGPASQSYGIQVAQLAGVPRPVIQLAKKKLYDLENHAYETIAHPQQADLFSVVRDEEHPVLTRLKIVDPDQLTPREALAVLFELRELAR